MVVLSSDAFFDELRKLPLFSTLKGRLLDELRTKHEVETPERGTLVYQGAFTTKFYVLLGGSASVWRTPEEPGRERERLAELHAGDWYGELGALSNRPFPGDLIVQGPSVLVSLPAETFRSFHAKDPGFRDKIDDLYKKRSLLLELRLAPLFRRLSRDDLARLAGRVEFRVCAEGEVVAKKGEPAEAVILVRSGGVARIEVKETGVVAIRAFYGTNSSLGERCLAEGADRLWPDDHRALTRTDVLVIPREVLLEVYRDREETISGLRTATRLILAEEEGVNTGVFGPGKLLGDTGTALTGAAQEQQEVLVRRQSFKGGEALVIDLKRCTRCNMCVESCVAVHEDGIPRLSKKGNRISIDLCLTTSCYNCEIPECMLACDHGAIRRDRQGLIRFVYDLCVGCTDCMTACPYDVIRMTPPPVEPQAPPEASLEEEVPGGLRGFLERVPGLKRFLGPRPESTATEDAPKKKCQGTGKAIKCDLCAGLPFEACVYNCPCNAISRVSPGDLWDRERSDVRTAAPVGKE